MTRTIFSYCMTIYRRTNDDSLLDSLSSGSNSKSMLIFDSVDSHHAQIYSIYTNGKLDAHPLHTSVPRFLLSTPAS